MLVCIGVVQKFFLHCCERWEECHWQQWFSYVSAHRIRWGEVATHFVILAYWKKSSIHLFMCLCLLASLDNFRKAWGSDNSISRPAFKREPGTFHSPFIQWEQFDLSAMSVEQMSSSMQPINYSVYDLSISMFSISFWIPLFQISDTTQIILQSAWRSHNS